MNIFKTGYFPPDLPKMFAAVKQKAISTAQYFANLIKHYSIMVYSCVVDRILPSRVKVLSPQPKVDVKQPSLKITPPPRPRNLQVAPSPVVVTKIVDVALKHTQSVETQTDEIFEPVAVREESAIIAEKSLPEVVSISTPEEKIPDYQEVPKIALATLRKSISEVNFDASVEKMIRLTKSLFPENNPELNQKLLDPFQTSVNLKD